MCIIHPVCATEIIIVTIYRGLKKHRLEIKPRNSKLTRCLVDKIVINKNCTTIFFT